MQHDALIAQEECTDMLTHKLANSATAEATTLYGDSDALAADMRTLLNALHRADPGLARKLKRAVDDVGVHVTEAMCTTGRERRDQYGAALLSARETLACLRAAETAGFLVNEARVHLEGGAERLIARLVTARAT
jgi:four helix bundle protein